MTQVAKPDASHPPSTASTALAGVVAAIKTLPKSPRSVLRQCVLAQRAHPQLKSHAILIEAVANALHDLGFYPQAARYFERLARTQAASSRALYNVGRSLLPAQQLSAANDWFNRSELLEPDYAMNLLGKGFVQLMTQNYAQGWPLYEQRLRAEGFVPREVKNVPLWAGKTEQPIAGKSIFIANEQGLGDTLMFFRYALLLAQMGAKVTVLVQPRLQRWLVQAVSGMGPIGALGGAITAVVAEGESVQKTDYWCPLPSLPAKLEAWNMVPPLLLPVPPSPLPQAQAGVLKVGLAWSGEALNSRNSQRTFEFNHMAALLGTPNVQFFNLQMGEPLLQAQKHPLWANVVDLVPLQADFYETAQHMAALDLIITVDTAVLHAAGALGKPFWALLDSGAEWRNGTANVNIHPFYPQGRLYRAPRRGLKRAAVLRLQRDLAVAAERFVNDSVAFKPPAMLKPLLQGSWLNVSQAKHGTFAYNRNDLLVGRSLALYGEVLEDELAVCTEALPRSGVAVEVGAGIGAHTVALAKYFKQGGKVLAFEAQRAQHALLQTNLTLNEISNANAYHIVVGAAGGAEYCTVPQFDPLQVHHFGGLNLSEPYAQGENVAVRALDSIALPSLVLLKLDVRGMELVVLQGAGRHLKSFQPLVYVCNPDQKTASAWLAYLRELAYTVFRHLVPLYNAANFAGNTNKVFGEKMCINYVAVPTGFKAPPDWVARHHLLVEGIR